MRTIVFSTQYKKDLKLARKRNFHELTNNFRGFRECHIRPDWLLLYTKEDNGELHILNLFRTGSHSDIF